MTVDTHVAAVVIVLCLVAALVGGLVRWIGGKMKLPDWASLAAALFFFGIVILTAHITG